MQKISASTKQLLTARDLASVLATSEAAVRAAVKEKREGVLIPQSVRLGRRRMWRVEDVETFIHQLGNGR